MFPYGYGDPSAQFGPPVYVQPPIYGGLAQQPFSSKFSAGGAATVRIQNDNPLTMWVVRQIYVVTNPKQPGCTADILDAVFGVATSYYAGTGDTARGDPPLYLPRGYFVDINFTGGPPNGQALAVAYYQEVPA